MDWKQNLHNYLKDELSDSVKYAELAKQTDGLSRQFFWDIAKEEYEHACAVWHMMKHEGMTQGMDKDAVFQTADIALKKR